MVLSRSEIERLELVRNADGTKYRDIGYDLTVGEIIVAADGTAPLYEKLGRLLPGSKHESPRRWRIEPQGMALVFARETIKLPHDVCGFALPKTSLCEEGILVLNTGIIDPCYEGCLSGTILNFSNTTLWLSEGDPFLRLVFHTVKHPIPEYVHAPLGRSKDTRVRQLLDRYPNTFLDVPAAVKKLTDDITGSLTGRVVYRATLIALVIAVATYFCSYVIPPRRSEDLAIVRQDAELHRMQNDTIRGLEERVQKLETTVRTSAPANNAVKRP